MTDVLYQGKSRFLWGTQFGGWMGEGNLLRKNRKVEYQLRGFEGAYANEQP